MARTKETTAKIAQMKTTKLDIELLGTSPLYLHGKARSYIRSEVWKQNNPRGAEPPNNINQPANVWEQLITSIEWLDPIEYHDDDYSLYSEEEWRRYMETNKPLLHSAKIGGAMKEVFISCYKEKTGKAGTDLQRALNFTDKGFPIEAGWYEPESIIIPGSGINRAPVVCNRNILHDWKCEVSIIVPESIFPAETIISILRNAGWMIGLSTNHKNGYGRFVIGNVIQTAMQI